MTMTLALINSDGTVVDTFDLEPEDAEGAIFNPEIIAWIRRTIVIAQKQD